MFLAGCEGGSPFAPFTPTIEKPDDSTATRVTILDPNPGEPATEPNDAAALRQALHDGLNALRREQGLEPLAISETLCEIADYHATRMIDCNFFSHVDPFDRSNVGSRAIKFDYPFVKVGENLAAGQRTPQQVLTDWMNSAGHRANILDPAYTDVGIAVLDGGRYGRYWALEFGRSIESP